MKLFPFFFPLAQGQDPFTYHPAYDPGQNFRFMVLENVASKEIMFIHILIIPGGKNKIEKKEKIP